MEQLDLSSIAPTDADPVSDPFSSGSDNRVRRWFARAGTWLFSPPYIPGILAVYVFLLILSFSIFMIMQQPNAYWTDHKIAFTNLWYGLVSINPLAMIGVHIVMGLIALLVLLVLTRSAAWIVWIILCLYYLSETSLLAKCGLRGYFIFTNQQLCAPIRFSTLTIAALVFGLAFTGAVALLRSRDENKPQRPPTTLVVSLGLLLAWLVFVSYGAVRAATAPQPAWHRLETQHAPEPRTSVAVVYDTQRQRAVMFGGATQWNSLGEWIGRGDTWEWDGSDWLEMQPAVSPPARLDTALAYDEKRGVVVLFGGQSQGLAMNDTWEWDGQTWTQRTPANAPSARCCFEMAYDPQREEVLLFSGFTSKNTPPTYENQFLKDVWSWNGSDWRQLNFKEDRTTHTYAMTYFPEIGNLLIFDSSGTWLLQSGQTTFLEQPFSPQGRQNAGLTYNALRRRVTLFGGVREGEFSDGTWEYDGEEWERIYPAEKPSKRDGHGVFYDPVLGRVVVFGGYDGQRILNDTWELIIP